MSVEDYDAFTGMKSPDVYELLYRYKFKEYPDL
jgi:hypothetical protein